MLDFNSSGNSEYSLITATWDKQAHGLFDYESTDINKSSYQLNNDADITREEETNTTNFNQKAKEPGFFLTVEEKTNEVPTDSLAHFYNEQNKLHLASNIKESYSYNLENIVLVQNKLWTLIEQKEEKGIKKEYFSNFQYTFNKNDIIRFGRVQYYVTEVHLSNNNNKETGTMLYEPIDTNVELDRKITCMECHKSDNRDDNPLIKMCSCKESNEYYHLNCYKTYIKNSDSFGIKTTKGKNLEINSIYNLICDHCKEPLNTFITRKGKIMSILPYKIDKSKNYPYLVLTSLNFIRENIFTTNIIIFYFPTLKEEFFLGRGHEATFRINDISISRVHSKIYAQNGVIKLDDLGSKFGTLLLLKKDISVQEIVNKKMKIQTGRTVFWIE